jgi:hypothetical protein
MRALIFLQVLAICWFIIFIRKIRLKLHKIANLQLTIYIYHDDMYNLLKVYLHGILTNISSAQWANPTIKSRTKI